MSSDRISINESNSFSFEKSIHFTHTRSFTCAKDTATSNNDFSMEKELNEYQEIVTKIILRHEIKRVWRRKIKVYKDTVAKMVHMQLSSAQKMADIWSKFAERVSNRN